MICQLQCEHHKANINRIDLTYPMCTCKQISSCLSVPKALLRSSVFATCPFETFMKTACVCNTSSISFSLNRQDKTKLFLFVVTFTLFLQLTLKCRTHILSGWNIEYIKSNFAGDLIWSTCVRKWILNASVRGRVCSSSMSFWTPPNLRWRCSLCK